MGKHVHWGYWPDPALADGSALDFARAAERLTTLCLAFAPVRDAQTVVDIGCGLGGTIGSMNDRFNSMNLIGVNIDARQLDIAQRSVIARKGNAVKFVEADACALPFADGSVDVVLAVECIFHFQSRTEFFKEAQRVLRPGGCLVLTDFVPMNTFDFLLKGCCRIGQHLVGGTYGPINSFITLPMYRDIAHSVGFSRNHRVDITAHTLPTYPVVRDVFKQAGRRDAVRATAVLEWLSRLGLLRYQLIKYIKGD